MATTAVPSKAGSKELKRDIGLIGLAWASMGSIIGSGWLLGARKAIVVAGPSATIGWAVGGVAIIILALVHAELGAMYPVSGGTARFPHFTFGGFAGATFGWFSWLQAATVAPIEVDAMISYATHWSWAQGFLKADGTLTGSGIGVAILLMAIFVFINLLSIRILAFTNSTATWWKIAVPLLTIFVIALTKFNSSNFSAGNGFAPAGAKGIFSAVASGGIIFALLGFEQADQLAGESRNPKRDIPWGIIGSMVIGVVIYIALQVVFIGALPHNLIPGSGSSWVGFAPIANLNFPFATIAMGAALAWLATILFIDAVISPGGTGLIYTTATSRVSYGLSRNGYFPSWFEKLNAQRVPWFGLIVSFVAGCIIFLPFPSWNSLVNIITGISVLMYAGAPVSLGALRRRMPQAERPYRLFGAEVLSPIAFIVANLLVLWTSWDFDWKIWVSFLIGYAIVFLTQVFRWNAVRPEMNWRNGAWIPVWLAGLLLITLWSSFGPLKWEAHPALPFGWDALVLAVFSLIIYYWAVASALPSEQIQANVADTVVAEDAELAPELAAA